MPSAVTRVPVTGASMILDPHGALILTSVPERVFTMCRIILRTNLKVELVVVFVISAQSNRDPSSRNVIEFRV